MNVLGFVAGKQTSALCWQPVRQALKADLLKV
jgi:hypothetical protein